MISQDFRSDAASSVRGERAQADGSELPPFESLRSVSFYAHVVVRFLHLSLKMQWFMVNRED